MLAEGSACGTAGSRGDPFRKGFAFGHGYAPPGAPCAFGSGVRGPGVDTRSHVGSPTDEDAPALAAVAAEAVEVLNDATAPDVGYPGLDDTRDVEHVLGALNRLAGDLQQTAAQLARYLDDELIEGRLVPAAGSNDEVAQTVVAARDILVGVGVSAQTLALRLTRAEAAMLALHRVPAPRDPAS